MPSESAMPNASIPDASIAEALMPDSALSGIASPQNAYDLHATKLTPDFAQSGLAWGTYLESIGVLLVLLFLLCLCFWAARRYGLFSMVPNAASLPRHALRLEGQMALGPRKGLMVVRCLDRRLVLGVTDQHISLLTELPLDGDSDADIGDADTGNTGAETGSTPKSQNVLDGKKAPDAKIIKAFSALMRKKA